MAGPKVAFGDAKRVAVRALRRVEIAGSATTVAEPDERVSLARVTHGTDAELLVEQERLVVVPQIQPGHRVGGGNERGAHHDDGQDKPLILGRLRLLWQ
jgi:hypothetical protein